MALVRPQEIAMVVLLLSEKDPTEVAILNLLIKMEMYNVKAGIKMDT